MYRIITDAMGDCGSVGKAVIHEPWKWCFDCSLFWPHPEVCLYKTVKPKPMALNLHLPVHKNFPMVIIIIVWQKER